MDNTAAYKLTRALGVELATAEALVKAGFTTENAAKNASLKALTDVTGIGLKTAQRIKGK